VWDKQGHIVTNYHVVRNAKFAQVALITPRKGEKAPFGLMPSQQQLPQQASTTSILSDDNSSLDIFSVSPSASRPNRFTSPEYKRTVFKAQVIGSDPGKDIAVLKIDAPEELLYPIQLGKSAGLKVGQLSLAIGNPFGLDHSLTAGVISGLGREVKSPIGRPITNVIQTDAAINPGNSGGVLLDSGGRLIGMNTAIFSPSGASAGIGFAIPVDTVKFIVETLIKDGKVVRPILGISFLESKQARALGIGRGVLVLDVPPDSPAAKAGLKGTRRTETGLVEIGDIIIKVGGTVIETEANLFEALEDYKPGDTIEVKVLRIDAVNDKLVQRDLTLQIQLQSSDTMQQLLR
jgi:S1-C subfamily serine protease